MSNDSKPTEKANQELEDVVKNDDGPEHTAPSNREYSSDFDESAGKDDAPKSAR